MSATPTYEDRLAAWELGLGEKPEDPAETERKRREQADKDAAAELLAGIRPGTLRTASILSSDGHTRYAVQERPDTVHGGTYVFCECVAWAFQRGKGQDCKHVRLAKAQWSRE